MTAAERWLGPSYREAESGSGRYLSANGEASGTLWFS
jgi:hypothetical protein